MASKNTSPDKIQLYVVIDGTPARKQLAELTQDAVKLRQEQKALREEEKLLVEQRKAAARANDTKEVARLTTELERVRNAYGQVTTAMKANGTAQDELRSGMGVMDLSLSELRKKQQALRASWNAGVGSKEALMSTAKELELVEQRIAALGTAQGRARAIWEEERKTIDLNKASLEQLRLERQRAQDIYDKAEGGSEVKSKAAEDLKQLNEMLRLQETEAGKAEAAWRELRGSMGVDQMSVDQLKQEANLLEKLANSMNSAEREASDVDQKLAQVRERLTQVNTEAGRNAAAWEEDRKTIDRTKWSLEQLRMEQERAQKIYDTAEGGSDEKKQAAADLQQVTAELKQQTTEAGRNATAWAEMRGSMQLDDMSIEQLKQEKAHLEQLLSTTQRTGPEFDRLEKELREVDAALKATTSETARNQRAWDEERKGLQLTHMSMDQLAKEIEHLKRAKAGLNPEKDAEKFNIYSRSLKEAEMRHKLLATGMGPLGRMWQEMKTQAASAMLVIGGMFTGGALIQGARNMIRSSAELSDAISDVKKTTGLSTPVVKELASELGKLDTRTSRAELLALARDAGKLGLSAKQDVLEFVRAGNQINVALGEDLGEDAIKNIGKLVDLFKLKEQFGLEQSMLKVGSALNELGMASTASEGYMVEFLKRMGGIAPIAGITIQETLALGATLDSLGQTSEVSSTALSKLFVKLGSDAEKYAGLAGMSVDKFKDILSKNALEAFIAVLEGTKKTEGGVVALAETLGDMGIDAARAAGIFGVLGQNTERLREQMEISNRAFAEGTSVTDEYKEKNENLAAQLEKLGKEFNRLIANNTIIDWLTGMVHTTRDVIDWMKRHADAIAMVVRVLATAVVAWASYRVGAMATVKLKSLMATLNTALATSYGVLTNKIKLADGAAKAFNATTKMSPLGLLLGVLSTATMLFMDFGKEVSAATTAQADFNEQAEKTKRHLETMDSLRKGSNVLAQMDEDQVKAHKQRLEAQLAAIKESNSEAMAQEQVDLTTMQRLRDKFLAQAKEAEAAAAEESSTIRKQKLLSRAREFAQAAQEESDRMVAISKGTYKDLSTVQTNADRESIEQQIKAADERLAALRTSGAAQVRTVAMIDDEIKALRDRQTGSTSPEDWKAYEEQIKRLERERARITGEAHKGAQKKQQENLDALEEQYRKFLDSIRQEQMDADTRELAQLDQKHADELKKVREQQEALVKAKKLTPEEAEVNLKFVTEHHNDERSNMVDGQAQKRVDAARDAEKAMNDLLADAHREHLAAEVEYYDQAIELARANGEDTVALERRRQNALKAAQALGGGEVLTLRQAQLQAQLQLMQAEHEEELEAIDLKWNEKIRLEQEKAEEFKALMEAAEGDPAAEDLAKLQLYNNNVLKLQNARNTAIEDANRSHRQRERAARRAVMAEERQEMAQRVQNVANWANAIAGIMAAAIQVRDAEIAAAEQRADADGVRTEEEIANIERLKEARRRAALRHIAVQAAAAVASGIASAMSSGLPFPYNLLAAAGSIATVIGLIAQAKAILNESSDTAQAPPQLDTRTLNAVPRGAKGLYARDGEVITADKGGGVLPGNLHSDGGNDVVDRKTGRTIANVEKGELMLVMSRKATEANADLIPALMKASREGTRLTPFDRPVATPDPVTVGRALRVVHMAQGGVVGNGNITTRTYWGNGGMAWGNQAPANGGGSTGADERMLTLLAELVQTQRRTAEAAESFPTQLRATTSIVEHERRQVEYDQLKHWSRGRSKRA